MGTKGANSTSGMYTGHTTNAQIDPFYLIAPHRASTVREVNNKPTTDLR